MIVRPDNKHFKLNEVIDILNKNGIYLFDILSHEKCDELRNNINDASSKKARELLIHNTKVKCFDLHPDVYEKYISSELLDHIECRLTTLSSFFTTKYGICNENIIVPQLRKIHGATDIHWDGTGRESQHRRILAVVIALNDDYEGGEFVFPLQDYKVKLEKGQALVFPPYWTHPHRTEDLKNGTFRYTVNTWFYE
jgi:predicted 2-oxoglutarate/Fe(II)-dependent dioxygenase YbiX